MFEKISVFIINLPDASDKYSHMKIICKKYKLGCVFVEATNGDCLNPDSLKKYYSSKWALQTIGRELSKGEIGCLLSHKNIYKHMIERSIHYALILEDDVDICSYIHQIIEAVPDFPDDWECVMLGYHQWGTRNKVYDISIWGQKKITDKHKLIKFTALVRGSYGYLLNLKGAQRLLDQLEKVPIDRPIDEYLGGINFLNLYGVNPPCITISEKYPENESALAVERNKILGQPKMDDRKGIKSKIKIILKKIKMLNLVTKIIKTIKLILYTIARVWNIIKLPKKKNNNEKI